jgi:hypothetical protein
VKKRCPRCEKNKGIDKFHKNASQCKTCRAEAWKAYMATPQGRARHLAAQKKYLLTPKGKRAMKRANAKAACARGQA